MVVVLSQVFLPKKGGQLFDYGFMAQHTPRMFHEARPTIVAGPLTVIFRTWQRCCHKHLCFDSLAAVLLWVNVVAPLQHFLRCKDNNG